ncbi:DNA-directed RNA polymerase subunit B [Candidatus Woesearchaeota archaeon]|nr:DNA-directed RNA polymerase subunit B [Candidatus Woesearchaeota archaeon]
MDRAKKILLQRYVEEEPIGQANIESYNYFIEHELQNILEENKEIEPTIIPHDIEEFKIRFNKIWVEMPDKTNEPKGPTITEADGSKRKIFPAEARLRKITYAAPIWLEVSAHINGIQKESFVTQIGSMPVMLKSKFCHLNKLPKEELIERGEDPEDPGGYFIINGTEKVIINIEDLASNKLLINKESIGPSKYVGRLFSEKGSIKIPHTFEKGSDGLFYLTFTRVKKIPIVVIIKALGLLSDEDIATAISPGKQYDDVYVNLYEFIDIKTQDDALDYIAKKIGITQSKEIRIERMKEVLSKYLLPHLGITEKENLFKARNMCKLLKHYIMVYNGEASVDDKDHYMNKRIKLAGDLLADAIRVNFKVLVNDLLYNFQRIVKRGKFPSIKVIIREKLLTSRIYSAMATGVWVGGRKGISQRIERLNFLQTLSHMQRVISPLSATQENFEARELHPTHFGRLCPVETPEGTNIGLRKNMALLCKVSQGIDEEKVVPGLKELGLDNAADATEVYLNNKFIGTVKNPEEFVQRVIDARRKKQVSREVNIYYNKRVDEIVVDSSKGRARRALLIAKDGKALLTEAHIKQLERRELKWSDLVDQSIVEYLDALEEENTLIAMVPAELTPNHTHLEVDPLTILGLCGSLVPYANYSPGARISMGAKNQKQALGIYASNFHLRIDTDVNVLHTPQKPIVDTVMGDLVDLDKHAAGQNIVVAVMSYGGYNMEDSVILNKASIERGLGRSTYFRPGTSEELRYAGGLVDKVCIPDKDVKGYKAEHDYRLLEDDGIIAPEAKVAEGDVIIGKTSPPRFLSGADEYNLTANIRRESSIAMMHGEEGIVDFVLVTENGEGNKLVRVRIRDQRVPEIGDKFTSRYGQKGVVGNIIDAANMPFSATGIVPDLIFSPHSIPSRMTISHLIELVGGKVGALAGRFIDGTTFSAESKDGLRSELLRLGFRENGTETLYNGETGEQIRATIYIGNMYYLKLKHMVANRIQSRARGPVQLLTRQPTEGRAKEGGLRLGEMEKDTFVAHGASLLLKERFDSDKTTVPVCESCGLIAVYDAYKNKAYCPVCGDTVSINNIEVSYAFKLMLDEVKSLGIYPRLKLRNKY